MTNTLSITPFPICNEDDFERAQEIIYTYMHTEAGTPEHTLVHIMAVLCEDWERHTGSSLPVDMVSLVEFRMAERGVTWADMEREGVERAEAEKVLTEFTRARNAYLELEERMVSLLGTPRLSARM